MKLVSIVSARREEAFAAQDVFRERGNLKNFTVERFGHLTYGLGTLPEDIAVTFSYPKDQGPEFALNHIKDLVAHIRPKMVLMTGVCAGLRGKVNLGDVIVAKSAFNYAAGKETPTGKDFAPNPVGPPEGFLSWVENQLRRNDNWRVYPLVDNPLPVYDPKEFLVRAIYEYQTHADDLSKSDWLWLFGFDISEGVRGNRGLITDYEDSLRGLLQEKAVVHLGGGKLEISRETIEKITDDLCLFDYPRAIGTRAPEAVFAVYGSGPAVRSDDLQRYFRADEVAEPNFGKRSKAFHECLEQHRETLALDMESSAFYTAMQNSKDIDFLVIKTAVDHADSKKNDGVHEFGKQLAAGYALEIIRNYGHWTPPATSEASSGEGVLAPPGLEVIAETTLPYFPGGKVSEPRWTVTVRNRTELEFRLTAFGLRLSDHKKVVWFVGGMPGDVQLPHLLRARRPASCSCEYRKIAASLMKEGVEPAIRFRPLVLDELGDEYVGEEITWNFKEWLESEE